MATYKCAYCGETGSSPTPPRTSCVAGRASHAWRQISDNRTIAWKCRKCGAITYDDQTPNPLEGGICAGENRTHTWDRLR